MWGKSKNLIFSIILAVAMLGLIGGEGDAFNTSSIIISNGTTANFTNG